MSTTLTSFKLNEIGERLSPLPNPALPLITRVSYWLQLCSFKLATSIGLMFLRLLLPSLKTYRPTFTKTYSCRPRLTNRVFIPKDHKSGEILPLYLDIHGGGFALCDPEYDDEFCSIFSNRFRILIVSVNYSKAPGAAFPVPTHDVAAIARAVIDDDSLPIDKSRVAIGGFSAGGNLALGASQLPELKGKIKAAVPWYPVTDWVTKTTEKLQQRPYKSPDHKDTLAWSGKLFNYGYVNAGQDLRDPLLTVSFARKEELPPWIFTVAAEYDMLANEAYEMMLRLAGTEKPTEEDKDAFEKGPYRWRLVRDVEHGFTHSRGQTGDAESKRVEIRDRVNDEVGEWLMKGPFAK